jgi:hypothetical protein
MGPDNLLCSRNARSRKTLVGRAQWKIKRAKRARTGAVVAAIIQWLSRWAMMSFASATGSVVKGAAC